MKFLSTLSLRRATYIRLRNNMCIRYFYPRSPCGERRHGQPWASKSDNFYPRSPCGERLVTNAVSYNCSTFLSTLSLRRATNWPRVMVSPTLYFYPRSPCGERRCIDARIAARNPISIHALLAESDAMLGSSIMINPDFYPRSPCGERLRDHQFAARL